MKRIIILILIIMNIHMNLQSKIILFSIIRVAVSTNVE